MLLALQLCGLLGSKNVTGATNLIDTAGQAATRYFCSLLTDSGFGKGSRPISCYTSAEPHSPCRRVSAQAQMTKEQLSRSGEVMYSLREKFMALTVMLFSRFSDCFSSRGPVCCELQRTWTILLENQKMAGKWDKRKRDLLLHLSISQRERKIKLN